MSLSAFRCLYVYFGIGTAINLDSQGRDLVPTPAKLLTRRGRPRRQPLRDPDEPSDGLAVPEGGGGAEQGVALLRQGPDGDLAWKKKQGIRKERFAFWLETWYNLLWD